MVNIFYRFTNITPNLINWRLISLDTSW
jgi:hypothetical protein